MELITPIIAASDLAAVPGEDIKTFILIVAGGLAIAVYAKQLFFSPKQKREVSFEFEPASKESFQQHVTANKAEHDQIFSKLGGVQRGVAADIETKVDSVRTQVAGVSREVSALQATTTLQNQTLARIDSKIDRLTERK